MQDVSASVPARAAMHHSAPKCTTISGGGATAPSATHVQDATYENPVQVTDKARLTPVQLRAAEMLLRGRPVSKIAAKLSVDRSTLYRWRTSDPHFIAYTNSRLNALTGSATIGTHRLLANAIRTVEHLLSEDREHLTLTEALRVLSVLKASRFVGQQLPDDPELVAEDLGLQ